VPVEAAGSHRVRRIVDVDTPSGFGDHHVRQSQIVDPFVTSCNAVQRGGAVAGLMSFQKLASAKGQQSYGKIKHASELLKTPQGQRCRHPLYRFKTSRPWLRHCDLPAERKHDRTKPRRRINERRTG